MSCRERPFSERVGARTIKPLGLQEMPEGLRVSLWNIIQPWIWSVPYPEYKGRAHWVYNFHAIRWPTDEIPHYDYSFEATQRLKAWFVSEAPWHAVYDFVEQLPEMVAAGQSKTVRTLPELRRTDIRALDNAMELIGAYSANLNAMLEREGAPYRYRNLQLVAITSQEELDEVERAATKTPFAGARIHIAAAIASLGQRPTPDYRNSVKESVSAIESLLQEATGQKGQKLPKLLDAFEAKTGADLHGAFKSALGSLYGWTSDDGGIRHGIFGEETVSHAEAQFMLVACSALVNFLVAKTK
jgi:AbiJ N-terminal domain 4